ncbi:outer membrane beta-barrel protein [Sphingobacterium sp. SYP-B4668]|uniref:outer membrane beta-barrel protein n=1 Tax=Sphingobacterium sp. SYP-B4668 TaxID=2996035 RepID=UPI0022DE1D0C|nr:PorT family protein [Sphingobacterium sp. SYP-B4668]
MKKIKTLIAVLTVIACWTQVSAQENDTTTVHENSSHKKHVSYSNNIGKNDTDRQIKYPRTFYGITFARVDWGFSRIIDNGSFNLSDDNQFLNYKRGKTTNFGFDVAQFGVRMNNHLRIYLSTGFEWNYTRLKENVLLNKNSTPLSYEVLDRNDVNFEKNILTSTYLRIPLTVELRSRRMANGDRLKVAFGPIGGVLLKGSQRLKSEENGKQKFRDDYNLQQFQYGAFVRAGFGNVGLFSKYYFNDIFEKSPNQKDLNNFTFGLTLFM